ncbi:MAG: alpha/beta fold hydrolase [Pseudomonadota bacterium]
MRLALAACVMLTLAACVNTRVPQMAPPSAAATQHPIHVATLQIPDPTASFFGADRVDTASFGRVTIGVPPSHMAGQIEWPPLNGAADPDRHFTVSSVERFDSRAAMIADIGRSEETLVYVHGFNTNAAEAVHQLAQIRHDFEIDGPTLSYVWPSAGDVRGYLYDRDSVLFARSDLEQTLDALTDRGGDVILVAHSLGSLLVMETLRQLALSGDRATLSRIAGVILVAPDLDPEVFKRQAEEIGTLPDPFVIFATQEDRVLRLSSLIYGRSSRLGSIRSSEDIDDLPVTVIDVSDFANGQSGNHLVALTSPALIQLLSNGRSGEDPLAFEKLASYILTEPRRAQRIAGLSPTGE